MSVTWQKYFRYSRMVGRKGRESLEHLAQTNPEFYGMALPPLPYAKASEKYCEKFKQIMGIVASGKDEERVMKMLDSQTLWDASMANSIAKVSSFFVLLLYFVSLQDVSLSPTIVVLE